MDSPYNKFQNTKTGGGGPPQFHNIMYPSKQNLFTNIFVNHPFQRTFASVVSCGNPAYNLRQSTSKLVNSFLEVLNNKDPLQHQYQQQQQQQQQHLQQQQQHQQQTPSSQPMVTNREFNDYKRMPNWRSMDQQQRYSNAKKGCPNNYNSINNNMRYRPPNKRFHYFHHYPHHHHHDAPNYHHNNNHFQKNRHEKERFSIERDIRNDRCDISNRYTSRGKPNRNNNNNQHKVTGSRSPPCATNTKTTESMNSPPFEIYSLEEFPSIVATTLSSICNSRSQLKMPQSQKDKNKTTPNKEQHQDVDEHDFVKFQSNIALTTPTYIQPPVRFNLCDAVTKIVTSPKKLLSLPLGTPKRSCLKATPLKSRSISECSDDYIIFDYTDSKKSPCMSRDTVDDEESDDDDDDVSSVGEEEDESDDSEEDDDEMEEEEDDEDECDRMNNNLDTDDYVQQPDSGIEEKKVHFNSAVKVNVIRAWDYAYRAARRGDVWLQCARDRERFKNRIKNCENVLHPILDSDHRRRVFTERFENA